MVEQQEIGMNTIMEHFYEFEISIRLFITQFLFFQMQRLIETFSYRIKTNLLMIVSVFYQLKHEIRSMNMKNGIDNF